MRSTLLSMSLSLRKPSLSIAVPVALALAVVLSAPACALKDRSSLASDTSGAEDVSGTESDVESLGTSLVGSNGQSVATRRSM